MSQCPFRIGEPADAPVLACYRVDNPKQLDIDEVRRIIARTGLVIVESIRVQRCAVNGATCLAFLGKTDSDSGPDKRLLQALADVLTPAKTALLLRHHLGIPTLTVEQCQQPTRRTASVD